MSQIPNVVFIYILFIESYITQIQLHHLSKAFFFITDLFMQLFIAMNHPRNSLLSYFIRCLCSLLTVQEVKIRNKTFKFKCWMKYTKYIGS